MEADPLKLTKVILVDDNPGDRALSLHALRREFGAFEVQEPTNQTQFENCFKEEPATLVITDYAIQWTNGIQVLQKVRQAWPETCVVMVTGTGSEEVAVEAMKLGLDDYVLKTEQHRARLIPAVLGVLNRRKQQAALQRLESQLREAQRMETVGQIATGVAHDFNNNLTIILSALQSVIDASAPMPEWQKDALRAAVMAAEHSAGLTRQLLTFSRRHVPAEEPLDLNVLVKRTSAMFKRVLHDKISLSVLPAKGDAWVYGDVGMIEQILMNLVINARDAMSNGGSLKVEVLLAPTIPEEHQGSFNAFKVSDNGCGIPKEAQLKIFEPFYTTKGWTKGTGIGLATVKTIVEQHHGWIHLESEAEKGTEFIIGLPAASPPKQKSPPEGDTPRTLKGETILLVEDEPQVAVLINLALSRSGCRVLQAVSFASAMELWRSHDDQISLILTDTVLFGGPSGIALLQQILTEKPEMRGLLMSGYFSEETATFVENRANIAFLEKPFTLTELIAKIHSVLV